jgi:hypothetical protein
MTVAGHHQQQEVGTSRARVSRSAAADVETEAIPPASPVPDEEPPDPPAEEDADADKEEDDDDDAPPAPAPLLPPLAVPSASPADVGCRPSCKARGMCEQQPSSCWSSPGRRPADPAAPPAPLARADDDEAEDADEDEEPFDGPAAFPGPSPLAATPREPSAAERPPPNAAASNTSLSALRANAAKEGRPAGVTVSPTRVTSAPEEEEEEEEAAPFSVA